MRFRSEIDQLWDELQRRGFTGREIGNIVSVLREETGDGKISQDTGIDAIRSWVEHGDPYNTVMMRLKGEPV